jgi:DNA-binding Lrp family transcriptional regulator
MLKVLRGYEVKAYNTLKNFKGVKEAYPIVGEYSIFVVVQAENMFILYRIIDSLTNIPEVTSIWNILVSKDCHISDTEIVFPEINISVKSRSRPISEHSYGGS